jgi:protein gp37
MWDWNDAKVPLPWILPILLTMEDCPQHTFQILSKRPKRYGRFNYPENVWLGTSLTSWRDQYVINDLLDLHNENLKFLSIEPLQGPLKFWLSKVDWVIVGAETGHRPGKIMPEREWVEKIIENCRAEAIPVFLKNNLGWPEKIQEYPREARP